MTKIYFSGAESWYPLMEECGVEHILFSYFVLRKSGHVQKKFQQAIDAGMKVFLDSGAHSLQEAGGKKSDKVISLDAYVDEYIEYLTEHGDQINTYVELDIDDVVGHKKVLEWRHKMEQADLQPMPVWHKNRKLTGWKTLCKEYDYIGLTTMGDSLNLPRLIKLKEIADKHDTRIHGFAATSPELLDKVHLYSADSTTWLTGGQFGRFYFFDRGHIQAYSKEQFWKKFKKAFNKLPAREMNRWNLHQWIAYSKHLQVKNNERNNA